MLCPNIALLDALQKIQRPEAEEMAAAKLGFLPHDLAPLKFLHFKHTTLPFVINELLMEIYSETMQISCFLLNFYPPILATIDAKCFTVKWKH